MRLNKVISLSLFEVFHKLGVPVQNFTFFHIAAPFVVITNSKFKISKLSFLIIVFYLYIILDSAVNLVIILFERQNINLLLSFGRQFAGLTLGILMFFALREIFMKTSEKEFGELVKIIFFLVLVSVLMFDIFLNHRIFRIMGTFTEPSHFGQYLVFIIFPSILLFVTQKHYKIILISIILFLIFLTFSFTTYFRLFIFLLFLALLSQNYPRKIKYLFMMFALLGIGYMVFIKFFQGSYVEYQLKRSFIALFVKKNLEEGTGSLVDRIQIIFILKNFYRLGVNIIWGLGLGMEKIFIFKYYPSNIINIILSTKGVDSYLNSFWGKILVYTGLLGVGIYIYILATAIKLSNILGKQSLVVRTAIISIYIYAFVGLAAFQFIELWFWLAFVDGVYLKVEKRRKLVDG